MDPRPFVTHTGQFFEQMSEIVDTSGTPMRRWGVDRSRRRKTRQPGPSLALLGAKLLTSETMGKSPGIETVEYLVQEDLRERYVHQLGKTQWLEVYGEHAQPSGWFGVYSALLSPCQVAEALDSPAWDLMKGDGLSGFSQYYEDGVPLVTYQPSSAQPVRPLGLLRSFHGAFEPYLEFCEDFRFFHNLAHDTQRGLLLDFDDSGYEQEVARIGQEAASVTLRAVTQFLAATQMTLALYFDVVRHSPLPLSVVPDELLDWTDSGPTWRVSMDIRDWPHDSFVSSSRLLGKVLIPPPLLEDSGAWPFREADPLVPFVIGVDSRGENVEYESEPDRLADYFGKNPDAPHYLTPVYFRKDVLAKYYADSSRYFVEDGQVGCLSLWRMRIDNDHRSHVIAFLGDLGRDLPHAERLHWKAHNVPPGEQMSRTAIRRSFLAEFAEAEAEDLTFRALYERLRSAWQEKFGWCLYREPSEDDRHLIQTVRVPLSNSQSEFDEQVLTLTKLLVDYLDDRSIAKRAGRGGAGERSIGKLERFLASADFPGREQHVGFLRQLQQLRSTGSGHSKGSSYRSVLQRLSIDPARRPDSFSKLLHSANEFLRSLANHYLGSDDGDAEPRR